MLRYNSKSINRSRRYQNHDNDTWLGFYVNEKGIALYHEVQPSVKEIKNKGYEPDYKLRCYHTIANPNHIPIQKLIFTRLRKKFRYEHEWIDFRKDLNKQLGIYRNLPKHWEEVLPTEIVKWASSRLSYWENKVGDACTDNYRVAKAGNTCQEKRYKRSLNKGCCGFFDTVEKCPVDGKVYKLGFNYGH